MEHRDVVAEAGAEAGHELRRERDLRHEHERAPACFAARGDGAQVHLGLARAGDAVQEKTLGSPLGERRFDGAGRFDLRLVQDRGLVSRDCLGEEWLARLFLLHDLDEPKLGELLRHAAGVAPLLLELGERRLTRVMQMSEHGGGRFAAYGQYAFRRKRRGRPLDGSYERNLMPHNVAKLRRTELLRQSACLRAFDARQGKPQDLADGR